MIEAKKEGSTLTGVEVQSARYAQGLDKQGEVVAEVDRRLSLARSVSREVDVNLKRAQALRQAVLARCFRMEK